MLYSTVLCTIWRERERVSVLSGETESKLGGISAVMAQAVAATVRAVKTGRKFIPRKAAIVLVSCTSTGTHLLLSSSVPTFVPPQTQSAVEKVRALLAESKDAVSAVQDVVKSCLLTGYNPLE